MITVEEYRRYLTSDKLNFILTLDGLMFSDDSFVNKAIFEIDKGSVFNIKWKVGRISEQIDVNRAIKCHKRVITGLKKLLSSIYSEYYLEDPIKDPTSELWAATVERYLKKVYHILSAILIENPEFIEKVSKPILKLIREYQEPSGHGFTSESLYENPNSKIDKLTLEKDQDQLVEFLVSNGSSLQSIVSYRKFEYSFGGGGTATWKTGDSEWRTDYNHIPYGIIGNLREIMKSPAREDPNFVKWLQKIVIDYTPEDLRNLAILSNILTDEEADAFSGIEILSLIWENEDKVWNELFYENIINTPMRPIKTFISCVYFKK